MNVIELVIVAWSVSVWVSDPCPDWEPDVYTGEYPGTMCAVIHGHYETKQKSAMFSNLESAQKFIDAAPPEIKSTMQILNNKEE